jgi:hypothetical protein
VNEIRDIVARMLDETQPPMRPADEMLAAVRGAARRRARIAAAGTGALALVVVLGAGSIVRMVAQPSATGPVAAPAASAAPAHGERMAQRLRDALPAGMTVGTVETFSDIQAVGLPAPAQGRVRILAAAVLTVYADNREGEIYAYIVQDPTPAPDDLCADLQVPCTIALGGAIVRVVTMTDGKRGKKVEATRFLTGGRLVVGAWQSPSIDLASLTSAEHVVWPHPPMDEPPLDPQAVAALAADPAMLPV